MNIVRVAWFDQIQKNVEQIGPILWPVVMSDFRDSIGAGDSDFGIGIRQASEQKISNRLFDLHIER